ncbi:MAG TPA: IS66 family transposase [Chloroflexia bacterium]|nr:IS66 family transposase [Chloroflexia bacterium]
MPTDVRTSADPRDQRLADLAAQVARLHAQLAARDARIAELAAQLAAAQRAAHRQATPFARRERKADPQKPRRKRGQGRFARRATPTTVHVEQRVPLLVCPHCAGEVTDRATHEQFQVEIPPVEPVVTRFVTESGYCPACAKRVRATHPAQISTASGAAGVLLGPRVKALAADLHHRLGLSYGKIADLLAEVCGVPVTRGGRCQADAQLARLAAAIYDELVAAVRSSAVVHVDETGWRIGGLAAWLWVFTNQHRTVYTLATSRGHEVGLNILGQEFAGVLVADCFVAYDAAALRTWLQQKCVAHLLRELRELAQTKRGAGQAGLLELLALLRDALQLKAGARELRAPEYEAAASAVEARLDRLIAGAVRSRDADRARLGRRWHKHRPEILRFLYWEELDATNNQAERQLRPAVVTRKTGGCNRTNEGAAAHAIWMSVLATCRQRGLKILEYWIKLQQFGATPPSLVPADRASP